MTHQNAKLDALVARIRAEVEIRRTKSGKATVETNKTRAAREARERGSDPALTALMRASNDTKFAQKEDPYKHFHEVGRLSVIQKQICRCCEGVQVNVVAEMIHLRGKTDVDKPVADVWIRRSSANNHLPHEIPMWAPTYSVEFCAECIIIGSNTQCWDKEQVLQEASGQLPLIN